MCDNPNVKRYHRGNNDASRPNSLTAVLTVTLALDSECEHDAAAGVCEGTVTPKLRVVIASPAGPGNGEAEAGPIAAEYGLQHGGTFERFSGGPVAPGSEHWRVEAEVALGSLACTGGTAKGAVEIVRPGSPAAYLVDYDVEVKECGECVKNDVDVREGAPPRGIGEGGRVVDTFKEVKPGDPLPFPPKSGSPAGGVVGPDGQPGPAPTPLAPTPAPPPVRKPWYKRLWDWLKGLFS